MKIHANVTNSEGSHQVILRTGSNVHSISIPSKTDGFGSDINGGELLFLALATCYCNDVYREALKMKMKVKKVEVEVSGDFTADGEPATNVSYQAKVMADGGQEAIRQLMMHTDTVAEIQNTLRTATSVTLSRIEAVSGKDEDAQPIG